jgi:signal transduction histidine kinase/CheY-like chemotaxis protein
MSSEPNTARHRVVVFAPVQGTAERVVRVLEAAQIRCLSCDQIAELVAAIQGGAAAVVFTPEGLESAETSWVLQEALASQPDWSDLPLVAFSSAGRLTRWLPLGALSNTVILEPAPDDRAFVAVVRAALHRRQRQYTLQERFIRVSRSNRELSEALRAKDELFATLVHELRNPLNALETASRLVHSEKATAVTLKLAGDVIRRQVAMMTRLLEDLLDVARLRLNRLELRKENCLLAPIVRAAVEATQPLMDAKGHTLRIELPADEVAIVGDPSRISQVISNLLANAAKYTDRNGEIVLTLRHEGAEAVLEVSDNGIGIPPESLKEVFGMFTQLRAALPHSKGGVGIGLSLVKGIVELHGGTVEAYSEGENRGSRFTVRLPTAATAHESAASNEISLPARPVSSSILLADDDRDALEVLAALLRLEGYTVYLASDGIEALKIANERSLDALVLDLTMPNMSGYEVARNVRANGANSRNAKLIAVTGWARPADKLDALAAGFEHHLTKPIDVDALHALLSAKGP